MNIIKKIIYWIIELFNSLFKRKKRIYLSKDIKIKDGLVNKKSNMANINISNHEPMPSYMMASRDEMNDLLDSILELKKRLFDDISSYKKGEIDRIIQTLKNDRNISIEDNNKIMSELSNIDKIDWKLIDNTIGKYSDTYQKELNIIHENINEKEDYYYEFNHMIDKITNAIDNNRISIITVDSIEEEKDKLLTNKNLFNEIDSFKYFNTCFYELLNNYDETLLKEVKKEYNKINYVTISTQIIDKNIDKFKELENSYKAHRFNKHYYEREINRIKSEMQKLKNLKNKLDVQKELDLLRKELYTKSKDKYDILYNDEIFMNINKQCDDLMKNINAKVIDIKKEEKDNVDEIEKKRYLDNIIKRFQDIELARRYIMLANDEELDISNNLNSIVNCVEKVFTRYNIGLDNSFNFSKNKDKTELIILYNDLNRIIKVFNKEEYPQIEHINFRMDDLKEAVLYKKNELNKFLESKYNYQIKDEYTSKLDGLNYKKEKVKIKTKNDRDSQ